MPKYFSLVSKALLATALLGIAAAVFTVFYVRHQVHNQTVARERERANNVVKRNLAIHSFYASQLKPGLFRDLAAELKHGDYFNPAWMSSTYAIREIEAIYRQDGGDHFLYKEFADNARSPGNEATPFERELLERMRANPSLTEFETTQIIDGKPHQVFYRRGETLDESCIRCHGRPEEAPAQLVAVFGAERSFNKKPEKLASGIMVAIPHIDDLPLIGTLTSAMLAVISFLLFGVWMIMRRWVIAPVQLLHRHAEKLAGDERFIGVRIGPLGGREMAGLGAALDTLSSRLYGQQHQLEWIIEERTRDLEASRSLLNTIYQTVPVGLILLDRDGIVDDANAAFCRLCGSRRDAVVGQDLATIMPEAKGSAAPKDDLVEAFLAGRIAAQSEERRRAQGGRFIDLWVYRSIVTTAKGESLLLLVLVDISEMKSNQAQIHSLLQLYRTLYDNSPTGISLMRADGIDAGNLVEVNKSYAVLHGYDRDEMRGMNITQLDTPEQAQHVPERLRTIQTKGHASFVSRHQTRDGRNIDLQVNATAVEIAGIRHILCTETDITEHKRLIAELEQAKREAEKASAAKTSFLSHMSHEIRTPLNGIMGNLQLLRLSHLGEEEKEMLQNAETCGRALLDLISDLLDLARIEAGRLELVERPFAPADLIATTLATFTPRLLDGAVRLHGDVAQDVPQLLIGDESRLRQILFNIVGNAVKFTVKGEIRVNLLRNPSTHHDDHLPLLLEVHDTGPGIDPELVRQIGEPFLQGEGNYRMKSHGTGLGLAIVKRLAEAMRGSLTVTSHPGCGTTVRVAFLARSAVNGSQLSTVASSDRAPAATTGAVRVLVAEDDMFSRLVLQRFLEKPGIDIVTVTNGLEAIEELQKRSFDLVLLDIQMPGLNGLDALRIIRAGESGVLDPAVKTYAITAFAMEREKKEILAAGFDGYMAKPIELQQLHKLVESIRRD